MRNRRAGGRTTLRQRNIQEFCGAARIIVEHLVEVAHAIEQQHVRMLCFDAQVLAASWVCARRFLLSRSFTAWTLSHWQPRLSGRHS